MTDFALVSSGTAGWPSSGVRVFLSRVSHGVFGKSSVSGPFQGVSVLRNRQPALIPFNPCGVMKARSDLQIKSSLNFQGLEDANSLNCHYSSVFDLNF